MTSKPVDLPADLASAYLALLSEREMLQAERDVVVAERDTVVAERDIAVAQAANAQAMLSDSEALIASLELAIGAPKIIQRGNGNEPPTPDRHGQNERAMALGRRNWTFAGSQRGADRAAIMLSVITTCRCLIAGWSSRELLPYRILAGCVSVR